ncbi:MAG: hypothetical protein ABIU09_10190 [Pyrinomonadaceae bacterium]
MRLFTFIFYLLCFVSYVAGQKNVAIAEVQGETNTSPLAGQNVRISGIVTGRTRSGFFVQTADDKVDANKNTSEGIFVFTRTEPPADAAVGNSVTVNGMVEEFRRDNEPFALTITEISMRKDRDEMRLVSKSNPLPKLVVLTPTDFMSNAVDNLEKYEGMRVQIDELTVVGPTGGRVDTKSAASVSDGTFFGVLKPVPRPFREPGYDVREFATSEEKEKFKKDYPKAVFFDANPEVIRVDTDEQTASKPPESGTTTGGNTNGGSLNVSAMIEVKGLAGLLHYSYGKYTLLTDPDNKPTGSTSVKPNPLPVPTARQLVIAGMNLENFFDDHDDPAIKEDIVTPEAFARRLQKISMAIRDFMQSPDVVGIIEAENLPALKRLAAKINADTVAAGKPDSKYEAVLIEGNDGRGIDNGFLVKTSRIKILESKQFGKDNKYKNPDTGEDNFLNDRPPLLLRASIDDQKNGQPFEFTLLVNHLKSFLGYSDPKQKANVRMKKRLQAEFLAKLVQERQTANPKERIILLGDFNAFQFNDGITDIIGTIKGRPAGKTEVLNPSDDLVNPDLIDLVDVIAAPQRYSYVYDGNAQVLDHIIISETLRKHTTGFGYARINADYPEVLRNDGTRLERFSDHDPAVAFFTLDDMTTATKP